jgi:parvulin-like peptidyl-prolyl isomerase
MDFKKHTIYTVFILLVSCGTKQPADDQIVAQVGNSYLTKTNLNKIILDHGNNPTLKNALINQWVESELLYQAALRKGMDHDAKLNDILHEYYRQLLGNAFLESTRFPTITISNDSIRSFYLKNKANFIRPKDSAKIYHFIVETREQAEEIKNKLRRPSRSFDRKELYVDHNADLSTVYKNSLLKDLNNAIFNSRGSNAVVGPVRTKFGYHVIEIVSRAKKGSQIDLDEVYDEIRQRLLNEYYSERTFFIIDSLKTTFPVKIFMENIE